MIKFNAEQGLVVMVRLKSNLQKEPASQFFRLRLDAEVAFAKTVQAAERLDEDLKAGLPLKRV